MVYRKGLTYSMNLVNKTIMRILKKALKLVTDTIENTSENSTKLITETSFNNNETLKNLNDKLSKILNDRGLIAS